MGRVGRWQVVVRRFAVFGGEKEACERERERFLRDWRGRLEDGPVGHVLDPRNQVLEGSSHCEMPT